MAHKLTFNNPATKSGGAVERRVTVVPNKATVAKPVK